MNVGMLWLDDDRKRSLDEKVSRAVERQPPLDRIRAQR
jgi:hypothetical protein